MSYVKEYRVTIRLSAQMGRRIEATAKGAGMSMASLARLLLIRAFRDLKPGQSILALGALPEDEDEPEKTP